MKHKLLFVVMLAMLFVPVAALGNGVELVSNGGFEQPAISGPPPDCTVGGNGWIYCSSDAVPGWTVEWEGPGAGTLGNLEFQNSAVNLGGPDEGFQYVEMDTHGNPNCTPTCDNNVSIYQNLNTCANQPYTISYAWRPRPNVACSSMSLEVYWGGNLIATQKCADPNTNPDWVTVYHDVIASSDGTVLEFVEVGFGDQLGTFLDDVSVFGPEYPCVIEVDIDIKPNSFPNCFNVNGNGVIPVAILGSADFDVTQIELSTLLFGGLSVRVKGNDNLQCSVKDVSGDFSGGLEGAPDGYDDLVCQFADDAGAWTADNGTATLTGNLLAEFGGTPFTGTDTICLTPPE